LLPLIPLQKWGLSRTSSGSLDPLLQLLSTFATASPEVWVNEKVLAQIGRGEATILAISLSCRAVRLESPCRLQPLAIPSFLARSWAHPSPTGRRWAERFC